MLPGGAGSPCPEPRRTQLFWFGLGFRALGLDGLGIRVRNCFWGILGDEWGITYVNEGCFQGGNFFGG